MERLTPRELYDRVKVDDLYFQATNGGVTFGGGEPLMHAAFIRDFRALCGDRWRISAETCLNIPEKMLDTAIACVDEFIVDVKDTNPEIYRQYTDADNRQTLDNLRRLLESVGAGRVVVRVPHIPGYNKPDDVERSVAVLRRLGATRLDVFTYRCELE